MAGDQWRVEDDTQLKRRAKEDLSEKETVLLFAARMADRSYRAGIMMFNDTIKSGRMYMSARALMALVTVGGGWY